MTAIRKLHSTAGVVLRKSRIPSRITVLHLDPLLSRAPDRDCSEHTMSRIFPGRSTDHSWMNESIRKWILGMAKASRIHFATERLASQLTRHSVPFCSGFISAGGFTIQDPSGISDQEWRSYQESIVRSDGERMSSAISDATRMLGRGALMSITLEQDGLPYGIMIARNIPESSEISSHVLSLLGREAFQEVSFSDRILLRRRHISFGAAIAFLVDRAMPMIGASQGFAALSDLSTSGSRRVLSDLMT